MYYRIELDGTELRAQVLIGTEWKYIVRPTEKSKPIVTNERPKKGYRLTPMVESLIIDHARMTISPQQDNSNGKIIKFKYMNVI